MTSMDILIPDLPALMLPDNFKYHECITYFPFINNQYCVAIRVQKIVLGLQELHDSRVQEISFEKVR